MCKLTTKPTSYGDMYTQCLRGDYSLSQTSLKRILVMSLKPCSNGFVWMFQSPKLMSPSLRTTPGKRWTLIATLTSRKWSEGWNQNTYDSLLIFSWYSLYLIYDFQTYEVFSLYQPADSIRHAIIIV